MRILKWHLYILFVHAFLVLGCETPKHDQSIKNEQLKDVDTVSEAPLYTKTDGKLIVLMDNSMTSYFIYRGQPMGYEYEMVELFAKENGLELEVKIIYDVEHILDSLKAGYGDLVSANLTVSSKRLQTVSFSKPLFRTQQVLVQRLPENRSKLTLDQINNSLIRDRLDLVGKGVMVRKNSSYELILKNLISETGIDLNIEYAAGDVVTEHLIEMVANGEIDYTICDLNKAEIFNAYYDNIDIETPMSLSQPIAWAVNRGSSTLLDTIDYWIDKRAGSLEFNLINNRYFDLNRSTKGIIIKEYDFVKDGKISAYDEIIKKYASTINWDWRLLTAQIYKESKFNPRTTSWRGAIGLMQIMPATAKGYGVRKDQLVNPETNIKSGVKHLKMLEDIWMKELSDSLEIVKFTLGSYNVGQGHVQDAMRLAVKYKLDPHKWDDNVADMLLKKSIPKYYKDPVVKYGYCRGKEPVNYVKSIFESFELYRLFSS